MPDPAYLKLGCAELARRAQEAYGRLAVCDVCARQCGVDRTAGPEGVCRTGEHAQVASYGPHHGEERPLSGSRGSGTIFFARCNLRCIFCQNYELVCEDVGHEVDEQELARIMLVLQQRGCHNVNFVSPSHVVPQILSAVTLAAEHGLSLPLVYNTGGYDSVEMLELLDGVIDIYMPDLKYGDNDAALSYSGIADYVEVNQAAVLEMHRQVGDLVLDEEGIATRGLLVRHLVLPDNAAATDQVLEFIARKLGTDTYVNLMDQYYPHYRAVGHPRLGRPLSAADYRAALATARRLGLTRLDRDGA